MVATVGSMEIAGSIDTSNIDRGLSSIEGGLSRVQNRSQQVNSDFTRLNLAATNLAANFALAGIAGAGALLALAKGAPALAPQLAQISLASQNLTNQLGSALKPAFDFAGQALNTFAQFVNANQDTIRAFTEIAVNGLSNSLQGLINTWNVISNLPVPVLDISVGETLAAAAGGVAGPLLGAAGIAGVARFFGKNAAKKAFPAAAAGLTVAGDVATGTRPRDFISSGFTVGGAIVGGVLGGGAGAIPGAAIGGLIGEAIEGILNYRDRNNVNRTQESFV